MFIDSEVGWFSDRFNCIFVVGMREVSQKKLSRFYSQMYELSFMHFRTIKVLPLLKTCPISTVSVLSAASSRFCFKHKDGSMLSRLSWDCQYLCFYKLVVLSNGVSDRVLRSSIKWFVSNES